MNSKIKTDKLMRVIVNSETHFWLLLKTWSYFIFAFWEIWFPLHFFKFKWSCFIWFISITNLVCRVADFSSFQVAIWVWLVFEVNFRWGRCPIKTRLVFVCRSWWMIGRWFRKQRESSYAHLWRASTADLFRDSPQPLVWLFRQRFDCRVPNV